MASNEQTISNQLLSWLYARGFRGQQLYSADAALLGNIQAESGFNPNALAVNDGGPGVNAHGLVQWEGGRYTRLVNFAGPGGNPNSLQTQVGFLESELSGPYSYVLSDLRSAQSPAAAAQVVQARYEVSTPASLPARQSNAQAIYDQLLAGHPLTGGGTYTGGSGSAAAGGFGQGVATGVNEANLAGDFANPTSEIAPGGNWDPINWLGDAASASGSAVASGVESVITDVTKPLVHFLQDALLVIFGLVVISFGVYLIAKSSDDDGGTSTPAPEGPAEKEAAEHPEATEAAEAAE